MHFLDKLVVLETFDRFPIFFIASFLSLKGHFSLLLMDAT